MVFKADWNPFKIKNTHMYTIRVQPETEESSENDCTEEQRDKEWNEKRLNCQSFYFGSENKAAKRKKELKAVEENYKQAQ